MLIHLLFSINSTIHCFPNHSVPLLITSRWFFFAKSDIGFRNLSRDNLIFSPHCCFFGCQIFVWEPVRFFLLLVKIRFSLGKPASQSTVPAPPRPAVHCRPPGCQAGPQRRRRRRRRGRKGRIRRRGKEMKEEKKEGEGGEEQVQKWEGDNLLCLEQTSLHGEEFQIWSNYQRWRRGGRLHCTCLTHQKVQLGFEPRQQRKTSTMWLTTMKLWLKGCIIHKFCLLPQNWYLKLAGEEPD